MKSEQSAQWFLQKSNYVFANSSLKKIFLTNLCSLKMIKSVKDIVFSSASYYVGLILRGKGQRQQWSCNQVIGCSISYFLFTSLLNSKLMISIFYETNSVSNQSQLKKNKTKLNISEIAILIFLSTTVSVQSLNCSSVLLSLKSICLCLR